MSSAVPDSLLAGHVIAGYEVVRVLGAGGFGITYEALNPVTRRRMAVKEFFPAGLARRDSSSQVVYSHGEAGVFTWALDKFRSTTTALCDLDHPHILRVHDYLPANGTGYMIMEYLEGHTFDAWLISLEPNRPTAHALRPVLDPILDALAYVHGRGLIHRDIAPDNILITNQGRPVLIDFGALSQDLSKATRHMGTVGIAKQNYTAPEQARRDARPEPAADIYSIGAVLYRALAGSPPEDGPHRMAELALGAPDPYEPLSATGRTDPVLASTADACLAFRKGDRPESLHAVREHLGWTASVTPQPDPNLRTEVESSIPVSVKPLAARSDALVPSRPATPLHHSGQTGGPQPLSAVPIPVVPLSGSAPTPEHIVAHLSTALEQAPLPHPRPGADGPEPNRVFTEAFDNPERGRRGIGPLVPFGVLGLAALVVGGLVWTQVNGFRTTWVPLRAPARTQADVLDLPARQASVREVPRRQVDASERARLFAECDGVAADYNDPERPLGLRSYPSDEGINASKAVEACSEAIGASGSEVPRRAQYQLGRALAAQGKNDEARSWFEQAAYRGSAAAMLRLGMMDERGIGAAADRRRALAWYRNAAVAGDPRARSAVSRLDPAAAASIARPQPASGEQPAPRPVQAPILQRAVLYEENSADRQAPKPITGRVVWRTEDSSAGQRQPPGTALLANVEFPEIGLSAVLTFRRNTDPALPSSHTIEMSFTTPHGASNRVVQSVIGLQLKQGEAERGTPLAGVAVPVRQNLFLLGLSNLEPEVKRNTDLLQNRGWIDLPIRFASGQRAVITIEKGASGDRAVAEATRAWQGEQAQGRSGRP